MYWAFVNESIDAREARRLFGVIGAGGIVGGMAGGALAFSGWVNPISMLVVAGALLIVAAPLALRVIDPLSSRIVPITAEPRDAGSVLRDRYVQLLFLLFLVSGTAASLLDYQFKVAVQERFGRDAFQTARFFGSYHTIVNAAATLLQLLAGTFLLRRLGAAGVLSLVPGGLLVGLAGALVRSPGFLFVGALRTWEAGMRISVAKSAWEFLYFPLAGHRRRRAKTLVEAVGDRLSDALAAFIVLALMPIFGTGPRPVLAVTLLCAIIWLGLTVRLRRAYVQQLSRSIASQIDEPAPAGPPEAQLVQEAHHLLTSPFEKRVLYAFELLERFDPNGLDRRLGDLLDHPAASVRARALGRLADPAHPVASPLLGAFVRDESPEVRTAALRLYAARYEDAAQQIERLLASDDPAARTAALLHLISQPSKTSESQIAARIDTVLREGSAADRIAVAQALAIRPRPSSLHRLLLRLLEDPDPEVRRAAIAACGAVRLREFVPALVPLLGQAATREAARTALAEFGNRVVGTLGDYLADTSVALAVRRELPRVLSRIGTQDAANELLRVPWTTDAVLLVRLLQAQISIRAHDGQIVFPRPDVREALQRDVTLCLELQAHIATWKAEPTGRARDVLLSSLEEKSAAAAARAFERLGLLYPQREIAIAQRGLESRVRRTRAQALEYLDSTLFPEDRRLVMPILEEPERRQVLAEALYGIRPFTRQASLEALVRGGDPWLQACALYVIGAEKWRDLAPLLETAFESPTPLVAETAAWSRRRLR
jgi:AAA family ATP:ADP antiporter